MDFEHPTKVKALQERLHAFMDEYIYPNEQRYREEVQAGDRWQPTGIIEELKQKARAAGLWNLFLPDSHRGAGLSNLEYAPLCEIMGRAPSVFVDLAGDAKVRTAVHRALGDSIKHSARAGFTHWDALGPAESSLPGPAPKLFFTPAHILTRREQWGAESLRMRLVDAWRGFLAYITPWLGIELTAGRCGVERIYCEVLDGRTPPERAHVLAIQ